MIIIRDIKYKLDIGNKLWHMIEVRNIVSLSLLNECFCGIIVDLVGWVISILHNSSNDNNIALVLEFIMTSKLRNELYIYIVTQ